MVSGIHCLCLLHLHWPSALGLPILLRVWRSYPGSGGETIRRRVLRARAHVGVSVVVCVAHVPAITMRYQNAKPHVHVSICRCSLMPNRESTDGVRRPPSEGVGAPQVSVLDRVNQKRSG